MKVLIVGGTRFIGRHTVDRLVALGHEVAVFHRGVTEPSGLPDVVRHIHGERADLRDHSAAIRAFAPDTVVDMVPMNERDAQAVVDVAGGAADRIVAISSQDVYASYGVFSFGSGAVETSPVDETAPLRDRLYPYRNRFAVDHPLHDYDKIPAERTYLADAHLPATILRLPAVYGPHDAQHRLWPYLKRMLDERPVLLLAAEMAQWQWTRGYAENIADAIAVAATEDTAAGRIYNLGEPQAHTELQWIAAIASAVGWDGEVRTVPRADLPSHLRPDGNFTQSLEANTRRIRDELGYTERVNSGEALERTIAWERTNPDSRLGEDAFDYAAEDAVLR
ncbi:MAG: NAD-dependent epimerase/dehydratase family protein [Acidimicrobiia bacterium]|nr:NAD-dependent epimerase/dehydratase family protein [Acidimicrobiia bacterium]